MDVITQRRCLTALAGTLMLGAVGAGAWSLSGLPQMTQQSDSTDQPISIPATTDVETNQANDDPSLLNLSLRGPLEDAPTPSPRVTPPKRTVIPTPKPPAAPRLNFVILGTIIDPQQSLAIVADQENNFDVKGVGETLDLTPEGVSIDKIDSGQVTLVYEGKPSTFSVDKSRRAGKPGRPRNNGRNNNRGRPQ